MTMPAQHLPAAAAKRVALRVATLLTVALVGPVRAADNDPEVHLTWSPQQRVATATAAVSAQMLQTPVELVVIDRRGLEDPAEVGRRTDDADREVTLVAADPVEGFVGRSAALALEEWGIEPSSEADLELELGLLRFRVVESNQAVGATYEAQCRLEVALRGAGGAELWSGSVEGDATRYGRKFSDANISEVLSDALLEALGALLSDPSLHRAWTGEPAATSTGAPGLRAIAPEDLLAEVLRLAEGGVGEEQLVGFITGRELTRTLSAEDVLAWRDAGLPDAAIEAVLDLPVR
jgi:hypothetical protein